MTTWLPERCLTVTRAAAIFFVVNAQYLTLIEKLVREGRPEREIERIVQQLVKEDINASDDDLDELPTAA